MKKISPVVLCGGSGSRLWPMSRTESPKQFQKVGGEDSQSFFQMALSRHAGDMYSEPVIVTSMLHRNLVEDELAEISLSATIISEPLGRNTGPAVLAAAFFLAETDPESIMLVVPADHVIDGDMNSAIEAQVRAAQAGRIISFGITPRYAETGFGYIVNGAPVAGFPALHEISEFIEKPPLDVVEKLLRNGGALWASGISMFTAEVLIAEYTKFDPETVTAVRAALQNSIRNEKDVLLKDSDFILANASSTEATVFQKTKTIAAAKLDVDWNDIGSWTAIYGISKPDKSGNVLHGDVIAVEAENTMVHSQGRLVTVVGLSDIIIIDTPDALLVTKASESQNVKMVVEQLRRSNRPEAEKHIAMPAKKIADINSPGMMEFMKSDNFNLGVTTIEPNKEYTLKAGAKLQFIIVHGAVHASGSGWEKTVLQGGRIYSDSEADVVIRNISKVVAEMLSLTLGLQSEVGVTLPIKANDK